MINVEENFRAQGYGYLIMLKVEEIARKHNVEKITLNVFAFNTVARGLYEKLGYEIYATKEANFVPETDNKSIAKYEMVKIL